MEKCTITNFMKVTGSGSKIFLKNIDFTCSFYSKRVASQIITLLYRSQSGIQSGELKQAGQWFMHNCLLTGLTLRMVHFGGVSVFECFGTKSPCRNPLSQNLFSAKVAGQIQVARQHLGGWTASFRLELFFGFLC